MPVMNWKQETRNNPVYPKGTYKVQLVTWERVKASTGTPQIRWKCLIQGPEEHEGRYIIDHTALTEKALWKVANLINGFGIDTETMANVDTSSGAFEAICQACIGRTAYWRNDDGQDQNGNPKNNIVEYIRDQEQKVIGVDGIGEQDAPSFVR